jgi:GntR family transcriptional regulator / MocR family aminotransferase
MKNYNSPVESHFFELIHLQRKGSDPIYLQIVHQTIRAIRNGSLQIAYQLPGTRVIAEQLFIHRKTVVAAFEELEAQGWLTTKPNVGTFIANPEVIIQKRPSPQKNRKLAGFSFKTSQIVSSPFENNSIKLAFNDGQPDYRLIETDELHRFYRSAMKRKQIIEKMNDYSTQNNPFFLEKLSNYFNISKKVAISPKNCATSKQKEALLYAICQVIIQPNDLVLVGEKSHFAANMIFSQQRAFLKTYPMDNEGIDVDYIKKHYKKGQIRCIYVHTLQHYPTTVQMSEKRKKELIELAQEYQFIILEDGDGAEIYYHKALPLSLFHLDKDNRVIYLAKLGKILPPTFQNAYIVAAENFISEVNKYLALLEPQGDFVMQQAIGEIIEEGLLHRNQRKVLKQYQERKTYFEQQLYQHFAGLAKWNSPSGGFAFWLEWNDKISLIKLVKKCTENQLFIPKNCLYQDNKTCAIRLGFAHLTTKEMHRALSILKEAHTSLLLEKETVK